MPAPPLLSRFSSHCLKMLFKEIRNSTKAFPSAPNVVEISPITYQHHFQIISIFVDMSSEFLQTSVWKNVNYIRQN